MITSFSFFIQVAARYGLSESIKQRYRKILNKERNLGEKVSRSVITSTTLSVWEILIPLIFIFKIARQKQIREVFIKNHIFTKQLALDGAAEILKNRVSKEDAKGSIIEKTHHILKSDKSGMYSEKIRRKQMHEVDFLMDHYLRLLNTKEKQYEKMVKNAYVDRRAYIEFLKQLKQVEKETVEAALQTLGGKADTKRLTNIQAAVEKVRERDVESIFGQLKQKIK